MTLHRRARATIMQIVEDCGELQFVRVRLAEQEADAVNYPRLTGAVEVGDEVVVNTVAAELTLGSGGYHFVVANLSRGPELSHYGAGHILKLRYTPLQHEVLALEESASPHHAALTQADSLGGLPVAVATLHSQLGPIAAGLRALRPQARLVYLMTDSAALSLGFSHLVRRLKAAGLLTATISCGQAFGGDYEAVTVPSALLAARAALGADAVIVAPGIGHVGTGTRFGFSGLEQAAILDAVHALGGRAIAALRLSFADARPRHHGVSHHSLTILGRMTHARATVVVPLLPPDQAGIVNEQLAGLRDRHEVVTCDGEPALAALARANLRITSMGRGPEQDPAFFLAAGAAGMQAATMSEST